MASFRAISLLGLLGIFGFCGCHLLRETPPPSEAPSLVTDRAADRAEDLRDPAEEQALREEAADEAGEEDEADDTDEGDGAGDEDGGDAAKGGADKKEKKAREKKARDKSKGKNRDRAKKPRDGKERVSKKDGRDKPDRAKAPRAKAPKAKKESGPKVPVNPGPAPPPGDYEAAHKVAMEADEIRRVQKNRDLAEAKYLQAIEAGKKLLGTSRAKDACLMLARCEHGLGAIWLVRKDWETALTHYKNSCHYYRTGGFIQRIELSGSGGRVRQMEEKIRAEGRPIPDWKPPT